MADELPLVSQDVVLPVIGQDVAWVDAYNQNVFVGTLIAAHPSSHYDYPIWIAEVKTCRTPGGFEFQGCAGDKLSVTFKEYRAGLSTDEHKELLLKQNRHLDI